MLDRSVKSKISGRKKTDLFVAQIQELVKLNSTVGEGTEGPLLLEVGGDLRVGNGGVSLQQPKHRIVIIASRERKEHKSKIAAESTVSISFCSRVG